MADHANCDSAGRARTSRERLVSVVMPTCNAEAWVADTLDSLADQTWPHFELVVVDDASRDGTVAAVRARLTARFNHPWRIIESKANQGPGAARNAGLMVAAGDWIQFLDSDDFMAPDKLAVQMARGLEAPADVVALNSPWARCAFEKGRILPVGPTQRPDMEGRLPIMALVGEARPWSGALLYRRTALERIGGFDQTLRVWENETLIARLAATGRLETLPWQAPLYWWRVHGDRPRTRGEDRATALVWIEQMVRAADGLTLDEMELSAGDRAAILADITQWARGLYGNNLAAFRQFVAQARRLDPMVAPSHPPYAAALSRRFGYETAEAVARLDRAYVAVARILTLGLGGN